MQEKIKRDMILNAMQGLMNESSGDAIFVSDTTRKAGIGKESIYYYFPFKNDIMETAIERSYSMAIEKSKELATTANVSAFKKMEIIFWACIEAPSELERQEERSSFMGLQQNALVHWESISFLIKNLKSILSDIILQGMEEGSLTREYPQKIAKIVLVIPTAKLDNHLDSASAEEIQNLLRAFSWMQVKSVEIASKSLEFLWIQTSIR